MLSVFGYTVKTHESADGFLDALDSEDIGCVVADVRMPGTDGIGLVRELAGRNVALPVILISGHADVPMAVTAIKSGAEDFIPLDRLRRFGCHSLRGCRDGVPGSARIEPGCQRGRRYSINWPGLDRYASRKGLWQPGDFENELGLAATGEISRAASTKSFRGAGSCPRARNDTSKVIAGWSEPVESPIPPVTAQIQTAWSGCASRAVPA